MNSRADETTDLTVDVERQVGEVEAHLVLDLEPVLARELPVLVLRPRVLEEQADLLAKLSNSNAN